MLFLRRGVIFLFRRVTSQLDRNCAMFNQSAGNLDGFVLDYVISRCISGDMNLAAVCWASCAPGRFKELINRAGEKAAAGRVK